MKNDYAVLGVCYGGHDTSASLVINNKIIAACEQERFDLIKHSRSFPHEAINECLKIASIKLADVDEISIGVDVIDLIRKYYLKPAMKDKNVGPNRTEKFARQHDLSIAHQRMNKYKRTAIESVPEQQHLNRT